MFLQASAGFERAVAAIVQHATSQPYQGSNSSLFIRLRSFMPSCLAHALKDLKSAANTAVLHTLADSAFLFTSVHPIVMAFLEREFSIVEFVQNTPLSELEEVARSLVILNSLQCLPRQQGVTSLLSHQAPSIRWMAVLCMARYLHLSAPELQTMTVRASPDSHTRFQCESGLQQRQRNLQVC